MVWFVSEEEIVSHGPKKELSPEADETSNNEYNYDMKFVRLDIKSFENESIRLLNLRDKGDDVIPKGYKEGPSKDNICVYYGAVEGSSWYTLKTVGRIRKRPEDVAKTLLDPKSVPLFDENTAKVEVLETLNESTSIRLVSCVGVMFTAPREFCVASTFLHLENGQYIIATRSVDHPDARNRKKYVRAISMISGYIVTPIEGKDDECYVTIIAHFDLGGYVPPAVTRFLGGSAPIKLINKLKEVVKEP